MLLVPVFLYCCIHLLCKKFVNLSSDLLFLRRPVLVGSSYNYTNDIITIALICHIVKVNSTSCVIQWLHSLHSVGLALFVIREVCLLLRKKYLDLSKEYKFTNVKRVFYERWFYFFPRKLHHCFWRGKHDLTYHRKGILVNKI